MLRREFSGSVLKTNLSSSISNSATSISVTDGSSYPTGINPFVIVIDRGLSTEEKILISSRSEDTFTVASRGYDGSFAVAHPSGSFVDHVLDASVIQDMNDTTYDNAVLMWMEA
jgi:hypothetical protein